MAWVKWTNQNEVPAQESWPSVPRVSTGPNYARTGQPGAVVPGRGGLPGLLCVNPAANARERMADVSELQSLLRLGESLLH